MAITPTQPNKESVDHWTIGFAIDVSLSMWASVCNSNAGRLATMDGILRAFGTILSEVKRYVRSSAKTSISFQELRVFGYVFGLRLADGTEVCDLFRLMQIPNNLEKNFLKDEMRFEKYRSEIDALSIQLRDTFEKRATKNQLLLAKNVMRGNLFSLHYISQNVSENEVRQKIEEYITKCVAVEIRKRATAEVVEDLGLSTDLTFTMENFLEQWPSLSDQLLNINAFIGGSSPMCQALTMVYDRFERERKNSPVGSRELLFIISDGNSSDGNPYYEALKIAKSGVTIISCLTASSDVLFPKKFYSNSKPNWPVDIRRMYSLASRIDPDSREAKFFSRLGWQLEPRAMKLLVQINHSKILNDFDHDLLSPIEREYPETHSPDPAVLVDAKKVADESEEKVSVLLNLLRRLKTALLTRIQKSCSETLKPSPEEKRENLISALTDEDEQVRIDAADALAELSDDLAIEPLKEALVDPVSYVRLRAARALGNLHTPLAVPPLIEALKDEKSEVRSQVVSSLARLPFELTIELLTKELNGNFAESAAYILGETGDLRAVEPLLRLLQRTSKEESYIRASVVEALGKLGDKRAVEPLIEVLKSDPKGMVRRSAVKSLGLLDDQRAIEPLTEALCDFELFKGKVDYTAKALVQFGDEAVEPVLSIANRLISDAKLGRESQIKGDYETKSPSWETIRNRTIRIRARVARTLEQLGDERAIESLLELAAIDPYHYEPRKLVERGLFNSYYEYDYRRPSPARKALSSFGNKAVVAALKGLHNEDWKIRKFSAEFLGEKRDGRAMPPLITMLTSEFWFDRVNAAEALGNMADTQAIEPLEKALNDEHEDVRNAAKRALKKLQGYNTRN